VGEGLNEAVPLPVLLVAIAVAAVLYAAVRWWTSAQNSARRSDSLIVNLTAALMDNTAAVNQLHSVLTQPLTELQTHMASVPKLLEAVAKVGSAQLQMQQNPFGRRNAPIGQRDVTSANLEHEVQTIMRAEGITREEALMRLNPANAGSMWDGNVLGDWNR
jgi:hypothetical protein